ncbi:hypothetical protein CPB84DRAFT_1799824 [Gymnopilus junonius]|uniref:Uncharacterized protein n=1 Tax=Gymnopilus junonius TaxID=109634 RepID=A0A9P5N961_GYMJU|nr:hypothetical protein CPB84DRAFT_1799824 [Gymnopilus junonius]
MSPVSADPEYGSDYAQMNPPTPPPSDTSFHTYLSRISKVVKDINSLPWVMKERVTVDYYPERSKRRDEPKRHPAIAWRSEEHYRVEYDREAQAQAFGGGGEGDLADRMGGLGMSEASASAVRLITPRRAAVMDLDAEFDPTPRPTPLPAKPPNVAPSAPTTPSRFGFGGPFPPLPVYPPSAQLPITPLTRNANPLTPNPNPTMLPSDSVLFSNQAPPPPNNPVSTPDWDPSSACIQCAQYAEIFEVEDIAAQCECESQPAHPTSAYSALSTSSSARHSLPFSTPPTSFNSYQPHERKLTHT